MREKPDWLLVYGDTNSTLAGALAAAKLHIPVAHVEAGLRSFNRRMPEEINRVVTDHVSTALFVPTLTAMQHLANEGISAEKCRHVGDVMFDAAQLFGERAEQSSRVLQNLNLLKSSYVLATIHRAENTDDLSRLRIILSALGIVGKTLPVVWPIHPRTRKLLEQHQMHHLLGKGVRLIEPVGYLDMVMLEKNATVIATDSGGVQKEAFFFKVPCVTLRDETEWLELVEAGWNKLVSPIDGQTINAAIIKSIGGQGSVIMPYGNGAAGEKIAAYFVKHAQNISNE
jgi:UDP-GlcNAc3NAcA epimerase